ncbi:plastocyanin/azurin family copper-binding protein [Halorubellus sp. JP-L1]|uniref:plastocyanin/azurin family copper-binding protein n=1 Tax=Halorubellus sp. JP-L1 TaxID=2715753 RepID=UPI0034E98177
MANNTTTEGTPDGTGTTNGTETGGANETTGGGGASGPTEEVIVGPDGDLVYDPADLTIANGTTVNFVWESDDHNIVVDSQPDGAGWEGTEGPDSKTYDTGHEYSHTFTTNGEYAYFCQPHVGAGMEATITVQDSVDTGGGGGEQNPEHMGVPFQAHFVGLATILAIISSLLYTFYTLKYGESAHTAAPNKK